MFDFNFHYLPLKEPITDTILLFAIFLLIILVIPLIFKRIKIPGIIGLILAGVLIGKYGINLVGENSYIKLFADIGLLYIMFIAGLELDLTQFKLNKYKSILFGILTLIFPILISFPILYYFTDYSTIAVALISVMTASHTLVAYPIVSKLGLASNKSVAVTIGGTIIVDTAVLIILAFIIGRSNENFSSLNIMGFFIKIILFFIIMFWLVPKVSKLFFKKLETEKNAQFIFVLFVVFFAAIIAKLAGLEPIIGAFIAGITLNSLIPHSSTLMNRINFVGNSLFIPIFLVSIGMLVNLRIIFTDYRIIIYAIILSVLALSGKWIAAFITSIISGFNSNQRKIIFGLSSSRAAATLAIVIVGQEKNIIDDKILNATILLILITCIIASFVTEKASKKIILEDEKIDKNKRKIIFTKQENILIPATFGTGIEQLIEFASTVINKKLKHNITLFSVVASDENIEKNYSKTSEMLKKASEIVVQNEIPSNTQISIDNNISSGIVRFSKENDIDIIFMEWEHSRKLVEYFLGGTSDSIIENTNISIFICDFKQALNYFDKIILVAFPFADLEIGFIIWFQKVIDLAKDVNASITFYCTKETQNFALHLIEYQKVDILIHFINPKSWNSLNDINIIAKKDDLIIFSSIRKGAISYKGALENICQKLDKQFPDNSKIVIFPEEKNEHFVLEIFDDINSSPLNRGMEKLTSLKKIFRFFKRKK